MVKEKVEILYPQCPRRLSFTWKCVWRSNREIYFCNFRY